MGPWLYRSVLHLAYTYRVQGGVYNAPLLCSLKRPSHLGSTYRFSSTVHNEWHVRAECEALIGRSRLRE